MVSTAVWVATVTFGRLLRAVVSVPGTGHLVTMFQMWPGTATLRASAIVFVAWGIKSC